MVLAGNLWPLLKVLDSIFLILLIQAISYLCQQYSVVLPKWYLLRLNSAQVVFDNFCFRPDDVKSSAYVDSTQQFCLNCTCLGNRGSFVEIQLLSGSTIECYDGHTVTNQFTYQWACTYSFGATTIISINLSKLIPIIWSWNKRHHPTCIKITKMSFLMHINGLLL